MIIMVSSTGNTKSDACDPRFGRCQYFVKFDTESKAYEFIENKAVDASQGAGIAAAQIVVDHKADLLLTGNLGPKAFQVLNISNIKAYKTSGKTVEETIQSFDEHTYELIQVPGMPQK